jgi:hypothetical protein
MFLFRWNHDHVKPAFAAARPRDRWHSLQPRELVGNDRPFVGVVMYLSCRQLVSYMKEHFRNDERGRKRAFYFWPWHFSFFCRWVAGGSHSLRRSCMALSASTDAMQQRTDPAATHN